MIRSASQVIRKDLPYITCQVCKIAMGEVWDIAEQMRKDAPYNRVDEGEFQGRGRDESALSVTR